MFEDSKYNSWIIGIRSESVLRVCESQCYWTQYNYGRHCLASCNWLCLVSMALAGRVVRWKSLWIVSCTVRQGAVNDLYIGGPPWSEMSILCVCIDLSLTSCCANATPAYLNVPFWCMNTLSPTILKHILDKHGPVHKCMLTGITCKVSLAIDLMDFYLFYY